MGDRRLLPYIHRHPQTPSVYYDDDLAYWYAKRRRYPESAYYDTDPFPSRSYPRHYYDDYLTHRSLPAVSRRYDGYAAPPPRSLTYRDYDYRDHWLEKHCSHCRPLPRISSKLVPSMHYDEVRCPHCEVQMRRNEEKVMTYPWTPQHAPDDGTMILRKIEEDPIPHDTASAPSMLQGNKRRGFTHRNPAPNTAPPFLYINGREKRNLLSERDGGRAPFEKYRPSMFAIREDQELMNDVSPNDSVSNVGIHAFRSKPFNRDNPRHQRPKHSAYSEPYFQSSPRKVEPSPRPIRYNPRRQFDGHYVDIRNGKKYKYKVNYMDNGQVDSERRQLRSF